MPQHNLSSSTQSLIAGAIFDFAAYLTTRPKTIHVGASEVVPPLVEELQKWALLRKLELSKADVLGWDKTAAVVTLGDLVSEGKTVRRRIAGALHDFAQFAVTRGSSELENTIVRWAALRRIAIHDPQRAWAAPGL
jgi:hypothetical protein